MICAFDLPVLLREAAVVLEMVANRQLAYS